MMQTYLTIAYDKVANSLRVDSCGLFETRNPGRVCISLINNHLASDECDEIEAAKYCKGIIVVSESSGIRIFNDPFCTIPLYYTENATHFFASSDPQKLINYRTHTYDPAGVWQVLLLHSPLWNRTPYKDVKFMPSASELRVGTFSRLSRYWNFEFEPVRSDFNKETFFGNLDDLINEKFTDIHSDVVCMGLSGGNDSRLAAHYLAKNKHRFSKIKLVTYAAHPNSNEVKYARNVSRALGLDEPHLHLLKDSYYLNALNYLPQWSAGQINNLHCHFTSYLIQNGALEDRVTHISNYYTDAVFGYACGERELLNRIDSSAAYQCVKNAIYIPDSVRAEIIEDLQAALIPVGQNQTSFSSFDEIKYVVERNPRFHISLAFMQHQFMPTTLPFADMDILNMVMQAPISLRANKAILSDLLDHVNPRIKNLKSSANTEYFYGKKSRLRNGTLSERVEFGKFRLLNMLTQMLSKLSQGDFRIANPYQTEDQISLYRKNHGDLLTSILMDDKLCECLGYHALEQVFKDDLVLRNLAERYSLLCFHRLSAGGGA